MSIPLGRFVVVTGVSGSGKSSLAFDTIYAEGQRRYVETFSPYARQFLERLPPPAVDSVDGLPPAIAIRQLNPVRNSRSTVGTMTELTDHFKQLFASCSRPFCPKCGKEVSRATPDGVISDLFARGFEDRRAVIAFYVELPESVGREDALALLSAQGFTRVSDAPPASQGGAVRLRVAVDSVKIQRARRGRMAESLETAFSKGHGSLEVSILPAEGDSGETVLRYVSRLECPDCGHRFEEPSPNLFSFNSPIGACPKCKGFGRVIGVSESLVVPDPKKTIEQGCLKPFQTKSFIDAQHALVRRAREIGCPVNVPWEKLPKKWRKWVWDGETDDWDGGLWPGVAEFFRWLESRSYKMHVRVLLSRYREYATCPECGGSRFRDAALDWYLDAGDAGRKNICELSESTISDARAFLSAFSASEPAGTPRGDAAQSVLSRILPRLGYLEEAGTGYLTLDRQSRTLSGGEAQRIALTTALGSELTGTLFVLDEPSVGLHPRDVGKLVAILKRLRDSGNTVLVVEHDPGVILAADQVIELGPGPGSNGGNVVFQGTVPELLRSRKSVSAPWLRPSRAALQSGFQSPVAKTISQQRDRERRPGFGDLRLLGASEHNLRNIDVSFPIGVMTAVTGVSGSGKSTLVCDVLYPAVQRALGQPVAECGACRGVRGALEFFSVNLVDQSAIGKSARSTPASYVGAFDGIRILFAATEDAAEKGFHASDFSFNSGTGRCPSCEGSGFEHVEMQFLSDVYLPCETCGGLRYRPEILAVKLRRDDSDAEISIADVLDMTIEEALAAFQKHAEVAIPLKYLSDVGLGYLKVGQPVPTLSGGEAQRLKLAGFLAEILPLDDFYSASSSKSKKRGELSRLAPSLLLFDEPTTGLHFSDIDKLISVFKRIVANGHTIVVVEHNLQVIRSADWVIDLGPEGGADGGTIVAEGSPEMLVSSGVGATSDALRSDLSSR